MMLIIFATLLPLVKGSNILVFDVFSSKSHKMGLDPILEELLNRGHNVTEVVSFSFESAKQLKWPGLTQHILEDARRLLENEVPNPFENGNSSESILGRGVRMAEGIPRTVLNDKNFKAFLSSTKTQRFDVVLVCSLANDFLLPVAYLQEAPIILLISTPITPFHAWSLNVPHPPSFIPIILTPPSTPMTFPQRLMNFLKYLTVIILRNYHVMPKVESTMRILLKQHKFPRILDIERNASLLLINTNVGIDGARPTNPNIIEIGGAHCRQPNPLPKDLEEFVKGSGDAGFIIMSFGSTIRSSDMPDNIIKIFVKVFSKLPQRIIWKYEADNPGIQMPANILALKWLPQQDLLGHPKCRLTITHGGLFSLQEAVYNGVPLIGIPLLGDQDFNIMRAVHQGFALYIDWENLTEQQLELMIFNMTTDTRFKEAAKRASRLMRDQPQNPLDKAIFWIEYVIRHNGAGHLKSPARHLTIIQYLSLDVILVVFIGLLLAFTVSILAFKYIWKSASNLICTKRKQKSN